MASQKLSFVFQGKRFFEGDELPPLPQADPPHPPHKTLPTMYDLPSEFPEEPGLPDEFHDLQPQLLSRTLYLADYARKNYFTASDLNVYYTIEHPLWHKRPDWFLAVGVPRMHKGDVLRRSYVSWQERAAPCVIVEFLSPGTEQEDLGRFHEKYTTEAENTREKTLSISGKNGHSVETDGLIKKPPKKLEIYEKYLRVPHYIVYSRYTQVLRYFRLTGSHYEEQAPSEGTCRIWLDDFKIGLGIWHGEFEGALDHWLRWCDREGNWRLTDTEKERQEKENLQRNAMQAAQKLLKTGMGVDQVMEILSLSKEEVEQIATE